MPNRYVREGYLSSEKVAKLSAEAERLYFRLYLVVDDYGRFEARSVLIKNKAFPAHDSIETTKVVEWFKELVLKKMIRYYKIEDKAYFEIANFNQRTRSKSRYPDPVLEGV